MSLFTRSLLRATTRPTFYPTTATTFTKTTGITSLFARYLSDSTRAAIDNAIATSPVVLFMKGTPEFPQCGFSRASIQVLGLQGVDPQKFTAFNVLEDDELRQGIKEYSSWPTIPQLYVNKEFVGGCDILMSMHSSGELSELFEKAGVLAPGDEAEPTTSSSSSSSSESAEKKDSTKTE
ncbi:monothiol glutaredoxin grx5 [Orbilia oligospora]|uniref:Monothiol glutaredoxin-5, mitochondrial n=1 Tax=Orbilia oligospora TaxID=2813651 RepID=A0A7C8J7A8_ORBOL|nr:monothiol glutaredoxin grx5 [Orbilia oligospora]KAF3091715.1 monothiol glutaredoxin grx5 [Orbilia oligospora]KAF3104313.1 monothiol glutaredoxin grx5 [Orbilia oligospora]KAF3123900.1 monothiol glutaredoxin grx5 [Orbilia oligospora]KAF3126075.1 monothiol glutaredoxin grx5 [Orbilia oligospora]